MPDSRPLHEAIRVAADPMAVFDRIVRQSLALVPHADGASLEMRRDAETLEYLSAAGTLAPFIGLRLPVHGSFSGLTMLSGALQTCDDALDDPRVDRAAVSATGVRSMMCVPLSDQQGGAAVLKISAREPSAFTDQDAERLRRLARFLDVTVSVASDLAQVTADVLAELDEADSATSGEPDLQQQSARFVANVMTPGLVDEVDATSAIRAVLDDEALDIVVQPIVDLGAGEVVACEALSRFRASDRAPDWWFAAAQRVGLGSDLELLAVRKALSAMAQIPDTMRMAVNVGPRTVLHPDFTRVISGVDARRLTIELTEHDAVGDYDRLLTTLADIRSRGVRLSVDDTGSGYSGLTHILRLRPDVIKLDREMVTGVHEDPVKMAMATAIVSFASAIDARVIAEGLEEQAEVDCLHGLGIGYAQGFLFGRPMPPETLAARS